MGELEDYVADVGMSAVEKRNYSPTSTLPSCIQLRADIEFFGFVFLFPLVRIHIWRSPKSAIPQHVGNRNTLTA